ncbi:MAG: Trm112 family protein [bacterium]
MNIKEMIEEFLVCPKCKGQLELSAINKKIEEDNICESPILICRSCGVYYPVEDDIPVLLIDEARKLDDDN